MSIFSDRLAMWVAAMGQSLARFFSFRRQVSLGDGSFSRDELAAICHDAYTFEVPLEQGTPCRLGFCSDFMRIGH